MVAAVAELDTPIGVAPIVAVRGILHGGPLAVGGELVLGTRYGVGYVH